MGGCQACQFYPAPLPVEPRSLCTAAVAVGMRLSSHHHARPRVFDPIEYDSEARIDELVACETLPQCEAHVAARKNQIHKVSVASSGVIPLRQFCVRWVAVGVHLPVGLNATG